jgi:hypothetical protein
MTMQVDGGLNADTKVYRYVSVEAFLAFVETGRAVLTNINSWVDKWEAVLDKVPTIRVDGRPDEPLYSFHQDLFGQCWSLLHESDAMWRIYSPSRTGVQLTTSVSKFDLIRDAGHSYLGTVSYFTDLDHLLAQAGKQSTPFQTALFKRLAFEHEREVRYLVSGQSVEGTRITDTHITLPLDPAAFIERVTVDPRADDWYLEAIVRYSKRAGLRCIPARSRLYEPDPHLKLGIAKRWVPVKHQA